MPKVKETDNLIHKIYRRSFSDTTLFFYVKAQTGLLPGVTTRKAIENYHRFIGESNYDVGCCETTINRMTHELLELQRDEKPQTNKTP